MNDQTQIFIAQLAATIASGIMASRSSGYCLPEAVAGASVRIAMRIVSEVKAIKP